MNAKQRKKLSQLNENLEDVRNKIELMQYDEEEKLGNMPEGLQESEQGEAMQEAKDTLEGAIQSIDEAIDYLNEIIGG